MIEYRPITLDDVDALTAFALSALPDEPLLRVSRAKVRAVVQHFASDPRHFQMAAFEDSKPVAGIALSVQEMPFHERCEGVVAFCFSTVPGAGYRLVRSMMRWAMADLRIRCVMWAMNPGFDARMWRLAERCGFQRQQPMFVYVKGA